MDLDAASGRSSVLSNLFIIVSERSPGERLATHYELVAKDPEGVGGYFALTYLLPVRFIILMSNMTSHKNKF